MPWLAKYFLIYFFIFYSEVINVRDLAENLSDLTMESSRYDILLCPETFVSDMPHVWELLVPDLVDLSCAGAGCVGPEG